MASMFFVYDLADDEKFPVIGTENMDINGVELMSDDMFKMFAADVLMLTVRSCPGKRFDIVWEDTPDFNPVNSEFNFDA
jgi:hypothetical protein